MKFLAEFTSSYSLEPFRRPEFLAVADALNANIYTVETPSWWTNALDNIFFLFECDSLDAVKEIAERCVLLRAVYILFACAPSIEEVHQRRTSPSTNLVFGEDEKPCGMGDYHYQVETFGKKYSVEEKKKIIEPLEASLHHDGKVSWKPPMHQLFVHVFHTASCKAEAAVFFSYLVTDSARHSFLSKYDLRKRPYIGTTSMPPEESVVMANMCRIKPGDLVYDPFCGTGSLLVAAAHFGAHTFGSDADGRSLKGGSWKFQSSLQIQQQCAFALKNYTTEQLSSLSGDEISHPTMLTNFKLYNLPPPDRIRFNFSNWEKGFSSCIMRQGILDSILSDPPYGLREPQKKIVDDAQATEVDSYNINDVAKERKRRPLRSHYSTTDVIIDLIRFAADFLVIGGYIAFWHPTTDDYTNEELPVHPSMRIISNIPQRLSLKVIRRLVVMQKCFPVPEQRPDRMMCAPRQIADNLRALLDETCLPNNEEYTHYRMKVNRRRVAATQFWQQVQKESDTVLSTCEPHSVRGNRRGRKTARTQTQEQIVENRKKNFLIQQKKQELSHLTNMNLTREGK